MKILVVDDAANIRKALINIIKTHVDASYITQEASNGLEALEKVSTFQPDIVLTDVLMPKMDGLQFAMILKSQPQTQAIFIAAITGLSGDEQIQKIYASGVDFYIAKPFQMEDIVARLKVITALIAKQPLAVKEKQNVFNAYKDHTVKHFHITFYIASEEDLFLIFGYFDQHRYFANAIVLKDLMVVLIKAFRASPKGLKPFTILLEEGADTLYLSIEASPFMQTLVSQKTTFQKMFPTRVEKEVCTLSISTTVLLERKHQGAPAYRYELFSAKDLLSISSDEILSYVQDVQEAYNEFITLSEGTQEFNEVLKFSLSELLRQCMSLYKKLPNFDRITVALQSIAQGLSSVHASTLDAKEHAVLMQAILKLTHTIKSWIDRVMIEKKMRDVHSDDDAIMSACYAVEEVIK